MQSNPQAEWILWMVSWSSATLACWALVVSHRHLLALRRLEIRYRFFAIRDRLYLCAADGQIPVSSEAFSRLRNLLCRFIRFEERWGAGELAQLWSLSSKDIDLANRFVERLLTELPSDEARAAFIQMNLEALENFRRLIEMNSRIARILSFIQRTHVGRERLRQQQKTESFVEQLRTLAGTSAHAA